MAKFFYWPIYCYNWFMKNCAFCGDEIRNRYIQEEKFSFVILSNPRVVPGHLLIIPKRHVQKFAELTPTETLEMINLLGFYQEKILSKFSKGTEIRQNYRPYKKDSKIHVNHFHFHIIPREEADELEKKLDIHKRLFYKELSDKEREKIVKKLFD